MDVREKLREICDSLREIELVTLPAPEIARYLGPTLRKIKTARAQARSSLKGQYWLPAEPDRLKPTTGKGVFAHWRWGLLYLWKAADFIAHFSFQVRRRQNRSWVMIVPRPITPEERQRQIDEIERRNREVAERVKELNEMMGKLRDGLLPDLKQSYRNLRNVAQQVVKTAREAAKRAFAALPADSPLRERFARYIERGDGYRQDMEAADAGAIADRGQKAFTWYARCLTPKVHRRR